MSTVTIKKGETEFTYVVTLSVTDEWGKPYTVTTEFEGDRNEFLQYAERRLSQFAPEFIKEAQRIFDKTEAKKRYEARMAHWAESRL